MALSLTHTVLITVLLLAWTQTETAPSLTNLWKQFPLFTLNSFIQRNSLLLLADSFCQREPWIALKTCNDGLATEHFGIR
jgi:hypothetical protein